MMAKQESPQPEQPPLPQDITQWDLACRQYIEGVRRAAGRIAERVRRGLSPTYPLWPGNLRPCAAHLRWMVNLWDSRRAGKLDLSALRGYGVPETVILANTTENFHDIVEWLANVCREIEKLADDQRPTPAIVKDFDDILAALDREIAALPAVAEVEAAPASPPPPSSGLATRPKEGDAVSGINEHLLWQLQEIESSLDRCVPTNDVHVLHAIMDANTEWDEGNVARWPKGQLLHRYGCVRPGFIVPNGGLMFNLIRPPAAPFIIVADEKLDIGYLGEEPKEIKWGEFRHFTFYYFTGKGATRGTRLGLQLEQGTAEIEIALIDLLPACGIAPDGLMEGDNWSDPLLWLAAQRFHPMLEPFGFRGTPEDHWGQFMPAEVFIDPGADWKTATRYGIASIRRCLQASGNEKGQIGDNTPIVQVERTDVEAGTGTPPPSLQERCDPMPLEELCRRRMNTKNIRADKIKPLLEQYDLRREAPGKNLWPSELTTLMTKDCARG